MILNWSKRALEDADEYWTYISNDSLVAAGRWLDAVFSKVKLIANFPEMGKELQLMKGYRQIVVHSHLIVYRITEDSIEILRVLHGARLLSAKDLEETRETEE